MARIRPRPPPMSPRVRPNCVGWSHLDGRDGLRMMPRSR
nr:TPA_asm: m119.5 uORF 2 [Murid betaherpesvirus 1]DBA07900.1 TPA_asm: m119.5 uORF 2 [Murid betaherpesvirus 1]